MSSSDPSNPGKKQEEPATGSAAGDNPPVASTTPTGVEEIRKKLAESMEQTINFLKDTKEVVKDMRKSIEAEEAKKAE